LSRCRHCWYGVRTPDRIRAATGGLATMQPPLLGTRSTIPSAPCGCACWRRAIALCHGVIRRLREVCRKRGRPCGRPPGSRVDIRLRCPGSLATRQRGRAARCCCGRAPQKHPLCVSGDDVSAITSCRFRSDADGGAVYFVCCILYCGSVLPQSPWSQWARSHRCVKPPVLGTQSGIGASYRDVDG
jgi:hypothetical protein